MTTFMALSVIMKYEHDHEYSCSRYIHPHVDSIKVNLNVFIQLLYVIVLYITSKTGVVTLEAVLKFLEFSVFKLDHVIHIHTIVAIGKSCRAILVSNQHNLSVSCHVSMIKGKVLDQLWIS